MKNPFLKIFGIIGLIAMVSLVIVGISHEDSVSKINSDKTVSLSKKTMVNLKFSQWMNADGSRPDVVKGQIIVKLKDGQMFSKNTGLSNSPALNRAMQNAGIMNLQPMFPVLNGKLKYTAKTYGLDRMYYASLQSGKDEFEAARLLSMNDAVDYAEPKMIHKTDFTPNDPLFAGGSPGPQYDYFERMKVTQGWDIVRADSATGGIIPKANRVVIAVVDGGTMWSHQDLLPNLWINPLEDRNGNGVWDTAAYPAGDRDGIDQDGNGYVDDGIGWNFTFNFWNPRGHLTLNADHGTACASYFGAATHNALGMSGTAFNPQIMAVCVSSPSTDNSLWYGYEGIVYAADNGADIISCSWGSKNSYSTYAQDIVYAVRDAGILILAAAGNDGTNNDLDPHYPSNYRGLLAVGSVGKSTDTKSSFSNYGTTTPVYAVGENVVSCVDAAGGASYESSGWSGTSMATPMAAGLAGLLKTLHPGWSADQIRAQIRICSDSIDAANPSYAGKLGHGRVNFYRALTESHPGLEMMNYSLVNQTGEDVIFRKGDTLYLTITLKNVLFETALNVTLTASPSSDVTVLSSPASVAAIAPNQTVTFTPFVLKVSNSLTAIKNVFIKVSIAANSDSYKDATGMTIKVYPALPDWATQTSPASALNTVKAVNAQVVWAAGDGGEIIRTTDGGLNWELFTSPVVGTADIYNIDAINADTAFVTTSPGGTFLYRTTDGGLSWQQVYTNPDAAAFLDAIHMFDSQNGIAMGDPVGGKWMILKTTDYGASWYRIANEPTPASGEAGWNNSMCWIGNRHGWFGTNKSKVWRTTNGGENWVSSSSTVVNTVQVSFSDTLNGIVSFSGSSATSSYNRTTNGGAAWYSNSLPASTTSMHAAYAPNASYVWCATASGIMYRSVNNGLTGTWQTQILPPLTGTINHMAFIDTTAGWAVTSAGEILEVGSYVAAPRITSQPDTMAVIGTPYMYNVGAAGIPVPTYRLIEYPAGMTIDSVSGIINWTPEALGDFYVKISANNSLGISEQSYTLHVQSSSGIDDPHSGLPKTFALEQNYPNPFNPATSLRYQLPKRSMVELKVFNILGQEVATLVHGEQGPGVYQVQWNGADKHGVRVASGIYIYRLKAGDVVLTRKMMLIK